MCTAYDFHSARLAHAAGVDMLLVGDSLGMTMLGYDSTLPVTMDDMVRATQSVVRGAQGAFVVTDMPFMSYQSSFEEGMRNAGRLIKEGGAQAVKVEGATDDTLSLVEALVGAGIPVVAHLGLTPQSVNAFGGYGVQAKEARAATKLLLEARSVEGAGACAVVLECIPAELAVKVTEMLNIPTIGIGAGVGCNGEVQVFHDILGFGDFKPRHAKRFADAESYFTQALSDFVEQTRAGQFPDESNTTHVDVSVVKAAETAYLNTLAEAIDFESMLESSLYEDEHDES